MPKLNREFVEALSIPAAEFDRKPGFSYLSSGRSLPLEKHLVEARDYVGIGRLYEAFASADLMLLHLTPSQYASLVRVCFALTLASHWYRKGGETDLAVLPARRVLLEAEGLRQSGKLLKEYNISHYHWYLVELMADAAAIFDPQLALGLYQEALDGFSTIDRGLEVAEWNDYFIGWFLSAMEMDFKAEGQRKGWMFAKDRIPSKISQWLNS